MKVKPLQFTDGECGQSASAMMSFGLYEVFMGRTGWCAELQFCNHCINLSRKVGVSKSEAINICQKDFEKRVLDCLVKADDG